MNPIKEFLNDVEAKVLETRSDVISLIKMDHRKVDEMFAQYISSNDRQEKQNILKDIVLDLKVHATAEENKVYPSLDQADHDGFNESIEEHHLIKILLEELSVNDLSHDRVDAKVKVLSEVVKHHVKEEENKYLPELKDSGADLDQLGDQFTTEKDRLKADPSLMQERKNDAEPRPPRAKARPKKAPAAGSKNGAIKKAAASKKPVKKAATTTKKAVSKKVSASRKPAAKKTVTAKKVTVAKKTAPSKKAVTAKKSTPAKKAPARKASTTRASAPKAKSTRKKAS